ncbi:alpha-mannosidase [Gordoniibacillus kamchatkensis]|uniref:Alpha-mannosidase n=1 Tax=Gordoniibacillus kamchatkensis TaxID=1590651 RepID=A0ABR5AK09_9BACL|nr:glycoside hydrolase family 38 C-terminal domain-containing protein [Paenibacillus sp. VKM B-2647]KIL41372.1 alpha-mannosidase [Paenibacillus sp. VKM B-2647]
MPYETIKPGTLHAMKREIQRRIYTVIAPLSVEAWVTPEPVPYTQRQSGVHKMLKPGDRWGELWDCAWFRFRGDVPQEAAGQNVVLLIDVNGEVCIVDEEGSPYQGLTNINSEFDTSLGLPGKRVVAVTEHIARGGKVELWGDAGCNDLFGKYRGGTLKEADIAICHEEIHKLYYDVEVLLELAEQLPEPSSRRAQIMQALYDASLQLAKINDDSAAAARRRLAPELAKRGGDPTLTVSAVGHAHIDLAWLWPIRETIRKGARTFATALRMMERYPEYVFGASQPQLYEWIKERYPKLYGQVKARIAEGRWELQGAMWVEPDSNVSGGEALIRQIVYGQQFYKREFGQTVRSLWVPDIFGYTASLPQLLLKSGISYMVTQKLSWNMYNDYPHHTFFWEGIDGSKILTHLPPEDTYNSPAAPRSLAKIEREYKDCSVSDRALMLFGIGDGGGGPGEEHLERLRRETNLLGLPPVFQEPSIDFLDKLNERAGRYKTWRGELYLEKHQGTLTTQAKNKKFNRRMEKALRELEFAAVWNLLSDGGAPYPKEELDTIWKEVLLYQFHDILPGSSITRVYDESLARYETLLARTEGLIRERYAKLASGLDTGTMRKPYAIFNSLPWERTEWIRIEESWIRATVPPMGYALVDAEAAEAAALEPGLLRADRSGLENELVRVTLRDDGTICSICDKTADREIVPAGATANALTLYNEQGGDAWDFPADYRERASARLLPAEWKAYTDGPAAVIEQTYAFGASRIEQRIVVTAGSRTIEFRTKVNWQETNKMLRAAFPLDIRSETAICDIQFGYVKRPVHRNTSWDFARDEICAHHYVDLSEPAYGAVLLNDGKYGFRAADGELDINLLRSPGYPDPKADRGEHEFVYALLPHSGDWVSGNVYKEGYALNVPLRAVAANRGGGGGKGAAQAALMELGGSHVMIESVKRAEDSQDLIIRLYETAGGKSQARLKLHFPYSRLEWVNLLEEPADEVAEASGGELQMSFSAFEIKTLKVVL